MSRYLGELLIGEMIGNKCCEAQGRVEMFASYVTLIMLDIDHVGLTQAYHGALFVSRGKEDKRAATRSAYCI